MLCLLLLGIRLYVATAPRRRVLFPLYAIAATWAVAFGAYGVATDLIGANPQVLDTIGWSLTATRIAIPLAFALSIVVIHSFAGIAPPA